VRLRRVLALISFLSLSIAVQAQNAPIGISQWSQQITAGPMSIDMANGQMNLSIPILNKKGSPSFQYSLRGNFGNMGVINNSLELFGIINGGAALAPAGSGLGPCPNNIGGDYFAPGSVFAFWDNNSIRHVIFSNNPLPAPPPSCIPAFTAPVAWVFPDQSGYTMVFQPPSANGALLYDKHGMKIAGQSVTDPDGNSITESASASSSTVLSTGGTLTAAWIDSLGQPVLTKTDVYAAIPDPLTGQQARLTQSTLSYNDINGNPQSYVVTYSPYTVATAFTCTDGVGGTSLDVGPFTGYLVSSISLPTGAQYTFQYESTPGNSAAVTGRPLLIGLPSGGTIGFTYGNGNVGGNSVAGYNCNSGTIPFLQVTETDNRGNSTYRTYQNNANATIAVGYGTSWANGPGDFQVIETDSLGDVTTHNFMNEIEIKRVVNDVSRGTLQTVVTCFNGNFTGCGELNYQLQPVGAYPIFPANLSGGGLTPDLPVGGPISPPPVDYPINQTDVYTSNGNSPYSLVETVLDAVSDPTSVARYDQASLGAAPSGTPVSTTVTVYDTLAGPCGNLGTYIYDLPCSVTTYNGSASGPTVSQSQYTYSPTGHALSETDWVAGSTTVTKSFTYNANGTLSSEMDGNGNSTSYGYQCNNLLPSSITMPSVNGVQLNKRTDWDCPTGVAVDSYDPNGNETRYSYNDALLRLTETKQPDGGDTIVTYNTGTSLPWSITTSSAVTGSTQYTQTVLYDGLSRPYQKQVTTDPMGTDYVDTNYDSLGRVENVSNPHRSGSSPTDGSTGYTYDALNRIVQKTNPDGTSSSNTYSGNCTTFADENSNSRQTCVDGEGRLTQVIEDPGTTPHLNLQTGYIYDALNNLAQVSQNGGQSSGGLTRTFSYDGLSRLISATNPESGSVSYQYDANGNMIAKTSPQVNAAAGSGLTQTLGYCYDALNRLTAKLTAAGNASACSSPSPGQVLDSFSYDTSTVTGALNTLGQLTDEIAYVGSNSVAEHKPYQYDQAGRLQDDWQSILGGTPFTPTYTYDLIGNLASASPGPITGQPTDSQGNAPIFSFAHDGANRLETVTSSLSNSVQYPATLFQANSTSPASYGPVGLLNASFGITSAGGTPTVTQTRAYDQRTRILSEMDAAASVVITTASPATGQIVISGSEQQKTDQAVSGSAILTVTGSEGSVQTCIKIWVSETHSYQESCTTTYDTGTISIAFSGFPGFTAQATYGRGSSDPTVAAAIATALSVSGSPVTATANGNQVVITAIANGPTSDYLFTVTNGADFSAGNSGTLSGGSNAHPVYDSGTVTASVDGYTATVSYNQYDNTASIATNLASALQIQASSILTASSSGSTILITSLPTGPGADWLVSATVTYNSQVFTSASFKASATGLSGGQSAGTQPETIYSYSIPQTSGYDGTGNLLSVSDSVTGNWQFGYDVLNRLQSGSAGTGPYAGMNGCWSYDGFGNRLAEVYQPQPCPSSEASVPATAQYNQQNQIAWTSLDNVGSQILYDAAGNLQYDGLNNYFYDPEGRLCAVKTPTAAYQYIYDAEGRRVAQIALSTVPTACPTTITMPNKLYEIGINGEQFAEVGSTGSWMHTNVFSGGLMATYSGTDLYLSFTNWLGSKRAVITPDGYLNSYFDLPFGNGLVASGNAPDATEHHFTGKERDTESGLDNFGARYFGSNMGRFMSPDPINLTEERLLNPSNTLNKYAYGANNPLKYVDDDGKDITIFYERPSLSSFSAGHILMTAENQQTGAAAVMSFGPIRDNVSDTVHTLAGDPVVSTSEFGLAGATADSLRQQYASLTIQTTPEEAQQVIDWIGQHGGVEAIGGGYMLYDQNCTTVCRDALKMINKIAQGNNNWSPQSFWKTAFSQYAGSYWKNNFGWTGSQPGVNYGQPRGGYDSFQLLELLSKQCTDSWDDKTNTLTSSCH